MQKVFIEQEDGSLKPVEMPPTVAESAEILSQVLLRFRQQLADEGLAVECAKYVLRWN